MQFDHGPAIVSRNTGVLGSGFQIIHDLQHGDIFACYGADDGYIGHVLNGNAIAFRGTGINRDQFDAFTVNAGEGPGIICLEAQGDILPVNAQSVGPFFRQYRPDRFDLTAPFVANSLCVRIGGDNSLGGL